MRAWSIAGATILLSLLAAIVILSVDRGLFERSAPPPPVPSVRAAPKVATDPDRILMSDDGSTARLPRAESGIAIRSLLKAPAAMRYGDSLWNDRDVAPGKIWVRIDLRTQLLSVFRGGDEIGTAIVLYGADAKETPTGTFPILWKGRNHRSSLYDAPMPYTLRLTGDGVSIHGSNVRWGAATHGCIGVPEGFASRLFDVVDIGDTVVIVRSAAPSRT